MRRNLLIMGALAMLSSCSGADKSENKAAITNGAAPANAAVETGEPVAATPVVTAELRPGQWETTIEILRMDVPNLPKGMTLPRQAPATVRSCLTPEQARRPSAGFMTGKDGAGCTYENFSMSGGRIQGTLTCNHGGTSVRATMNGTFSAESYQMETEAQTQANGMNVSTATRITSRRTGDCPG